MRACYWTPPFFSYPPVIIIIQLWRVQSVYTPLWSIKVRYTAVEIYDQQIVNERFGTLFQVLINSHEKLFIIRINDKHFLHFLGRIL